MTSTHLPQEIIDLIIDEVACHGSRATLKTCSVVSMAFYLASRKHLFSDISFLVDTSCQTRAAELIKVLQNNDGYLIPAIRSLNLKFDMAGLPPPRAFLKSRDTIQQILRKLGVEKNHLLELLNLLSQRPLESLRLIGLLRFTWSSPFILPSTESLLSRIFSSNSLNTLHLVNIGKIPKSLLVAAITSSSLIDLKLSSVFFDRKDPLEVPTTANPKSLAMLEKLELTDLIYSPFFNLLQSILPTPPARVFSRLRTFRASSKMSGEWRQLSQFVVQSMPSLDTLEFIQRESTLDHMIYEGLALFYLPQIASLQHLKFIITSYGEDGFIAKQIALSRLFARTSPTKIISVVVEFHAHLNQVYEDDPLAPSRPGWAALDEALSSPVFGDVRTVFFSVKLCRTASGTSSIFLEAEGHAKASTLTPLLARCAPRLAVEIFWSLYSVPLGQSLNFD